MSEEFNLERINKAIRAINQFADPARLEEAARIRAHDERVMERAMELCKDQCFLAEAFSEMDEADILAVGKLSMNDDMPSEAAIGRIVGRGIKAYAMKCAERDLQWMAYEESK